MKTTIIPQKSLRAAAALLLAIFIAAGFTACSNEDNSIETFTPEMVVGKWYVELQEQGTYGEGDAAFEFYKVALYGNLNADGTGTWYALFFNPYGNLIDTGGVFFGSGCQYTTTADGGVHVELEGQSSISDLMPSWDMTYKAGRLVSSDADGNIKMFPITPEQEALVQLCLRELGMGYDGEENIVELSELTSDYVAQDGDILKGDLKAKVTVSIANGATVTLRDCSLGQEDVHKPALNCLGSANIILEGASYLTGGNGGYPGVYVPKGSTLTIGGFGGIYSTGGKMGAGIGGGNAKNYKDCGDIVIKSGRVNAIGQLRSAGIGTGQGGSCGDIIIEGGEIYALGGADGAGIGGGYMGSCKEIVLTGGKVDVQGGDHYPAVGCGPEEGCFCDTIRVFGGDISCIAGKDSPNALGSSYNGKGLCNSVLLSYKIKSLYMKGQSKKAQKAFELFNNHHFLASYLPLKDYWWLITVKFDEGANEVSKGIHYIVTSDRSISIIPQEDVLNYIEISPDSGFVW